MDTERSGQTDGSTIDASTVQHDLARYDWLANATSLPWQASAVQFEPASYASWPTVTAMLPWQASAATTNARALQLVNYNYWLAPASAATTDAGTAFDTLQPGQTSTEMFDFVAKESLKMQKKKDSNRRSAAKSRQIRKERSNTLEQLVVRQKAEISCLRNQVNVLTEKNKSLNDDLQLYRGLHELSSAKRVKHQAVSASSQRSCNSCAFFSLASGTNASISEHCSLSDPDATLTSPVNSATSPTYCLEITSSQFPVSLSPTIDNTGRNTAIDVISSEEEMLTYGRYGSTLF